ncbi:hypothetical protein BU16DRAFT_566592 [Lophium mytilinum]|uniref:Uncharacterized protein n=1 Tax=Lophium mytilinum TaxID=390894 RepID=A0A6A6QEK3_9PEZI|nr:hypothetical protein BU16DRAFT_566592 [Lophium mytilinum]
MVYIRDMIAKYVLDETISGKPERRAVLAAEAAAAQQKEDDMVRQRGMIGDITIVGPKSIDLTAIFQEIGAVPADVEERAKRAREREEGEIEEREAEGEEYDPLRPQLSKAAARGRAKTPPWRERREVFVEDPALQAKVFGYTDPTKACRECLLRPVDQRGRFDRRGRCERHCSRKWEKTSISLCDHKWLELYWELEDPANLQGGWQLVAVGERGSRVDVEKRCETCEVEKAPNDRCEELAKRVVAHAETKLGLEKKEFERIEQRSGQLAKREVRRLEGFRRDAENKMGPWRGNVKVEVPNKPFAEREIRVLLLALKEQESKERERQKRKKQREVEQMLKNFEALRPENLLHQSTEMQELVASVEDQVVESVEVSLEESVQTTDTEGQAHYFPPPPPRNTEDVPAIIPPPETEETILEYQNAIQSGDPPATTDSMVANRGSPVPTLEPEVTDISISVPTPEAVSAILSSLTSTALEKEAKEEHLDAELATGIPATEQPGAVLTTASLEALQSEIELEKLVAEPTPEDNVTLPAPEEISTIPSTPESATLELEAEDEKVDAVITPISDSSEASSKDTSLPLSSVESLEVDIEINANEVVATSIEQAIETVTSVSPSLPTPLSSPLANPESAATSSTDQPIEAAPSPSLPPLLSPFLANLHPPRQTHPPRSRSPSPSPSLSPPLPPPRKGSRTASLPLASLALIKRPRLSSLPNILDPTNSLLLSPPTAPKARRDSLALYTARKRSATRRRSSASASSSTRRKRSRTASVAETTLSAIAVVKRARVGSQSSSGSTARSNGSGSESGSSSLSEGSADSITEATSGSVDNGEDSSDASEATPSQTSSLRARKAVQFRKRKSYIEDETDFSDGELEAVPRKRVRSL